MKPLDRKFYLRDTLTVAQELLGKFLVHEYQGMRLAGRITETEAYIGAVDKACHAYNGKRTPRTETLYRIGGTSYVYLIYGIYSCMNIVTEEEGAAAAVLIRGLDVIDGMEQASHFRYGKPFDQLTKLQKRNFSNGPGKLCKAMAITREQNNLDICKGGFFVSEHFAGYEEQPFSIGSAPRIGIDYAEEAKDFPWRFFIT